MSLNFTILFPGASMIKVVRFRGCILSFMMAQKILFWMYVISLLIMTSIDGYMIQWTNISRRTTLRKYMYTQSRLLKHINFWQVKTRHQCNTADPLHSRGALHTVLQCLSHTPLCISMISGLCVQGMWNAQVKSQVTETHRSKVNSYCDTALFISVYDITMAQS